MKRDQAIKVQWKSEDGRMMFLEGTILSWETKMIREDIPVAQRDQESVYHRRYRPGEPIITLMFECDEVCVRRAEPGEGVTA